MGRFASTASTYEHLRPPYPGEFFRRAAQKLGLSERCALIDLGTGPGLLALGFAPYVGRIVGVFRGSAFAPTELVAVETSHTVSMRDLAQRTLLVVLTGSVGRQRRGAVARRREPSGIVRPRRLDRRDHRLDGADREALDGLPRKAGSKAIQTTPPQDWIARPSFHSSI